MTFSHSLKTTASPAAIWSLWTDVSNWPMWDTELRSAYLHDDFEEGVEGYLEPKVGPSSRIAISDVEPGRSYTFTVRLPLCRMHVMRDLRPTATGASFTHTVSLSGPLAWLFSRLLGRRFRTELPKVMERLRHLAEETPLPA